MCICVFLLKCYMFLLKRVYVCISCSVVCTLSNSMDCSLPGSSVHGILQVRILEWVAIAFSKGPSRSRDWNWVSWTAGRFFTLWATREALICVWTTQFMFWENSIETCILLRVKQITSPGWLHETSARGWCARRTQRDGVGREVGVGIGMGNTCKSMADSC